MMNIFFLNGQLPTKSPDSSLMSSIGQAFFVVLILILTLAIIYFFAYMAKRLKIGTSNSNNIKVIEYKNIGNNNNLLIVNIGEKYMLLSANKEHVNFISDIDKENLTLNEEETQNFNFKQTLDNVFYKNKSGDKKE